MTFWTTVSCCNLKLIILCSPNKSNNWLFWSGVPTSAAFWGTLLLSRPALSARPCRGCRVCDRYQPLTPTLTVGACLLTINLPSGFNVNYNFFIYYLIYNDFFFFFYHFATSAAKRFCEKKSGNVLKIIQNGAQVKLAQSARKLWHTI